MWVALILFRERIRTVWILFHKKSSVASGLESGRSNAAVGTGLDAQFFVESHGDYNIHGHPDRQLL